MIGVDHAASLEHDEELVAIVMAVVFVPRARLEHRPADHVIGIGRFLVDQELHLHVHPAVVALEPFDLGHVAQIGAKHDRSRLAFRPCGGGAFHGLGQRGPDFFTL